VAEGNYRAALDHIARIDTAHGSPNSAGENPWHAALVYAVEVAKRALEQGDGGPRPLQVGDILGRQIEDGYDGFCGGEFGRDSYDLKRVEKIEGDYVVCRNESGRAEFYSGNPGDLVEYVLPENAKTLFGF
jgi:hypothetical protein